MKIALIICAAIFFIFSVIFLWLFIMGADENRRGNSQGHKQQVEKKTSAASDGAIAEGD